MPIIHTINSVFHDRIPYFILVNFILLVILICLNWKYIKKFLLKVDKKTWLVLLLIFIIALLVRVFIPPYHHIMYIDEPWYMEAGKDMLQTGQQGTYPKSIGWPFILRIVFGIFGVSNYVALYTSTVLGALTVFNIFFLAFMITKNKPASLASSLMFSLFAAHIRWSASAETNVASLFFITLTLFFCFLYYENKKTSLLWLSLVSLAFTSQFRPENYIFPFLFLFGCVLFDKKFFKNADLNFVLPWLVLIILSFADFVQVTDFNTSINWIEHYTGGRETGKNFGFSNFVYNSSTYGRYLFDNSFQPWLFTLLFVAGMFYMFYKQKREALFLLTWFCCLAIAYSFSHPFMGGSMDVSAKTRSFMSFYPITTIFMSYGILLVKRLMPDKFCIKKYTFPLLTIIVASLFVPYSVQASSLFFSIPCKLETKIPELAERDIPGSCVIVANWPTILKSTTNLNVVDIKDFLNQEKFRKEIFNRTDCVLFFEDLYCLDFSGFEEDCQAIKESYDLEKYIFYNEKNKVYTFYKLKSSGKVKGVSSSS